MCKDESQGKKWHNRNFSGERRHSVIQGLRSRASRTHNDAVIHVIKCKKHVYFVAMPLSDEIACSKLSLNGERTKDVCSLRFDINYSNWNLERHIPLQTKTLYTMYEIFWRTELGQQPTLRTKPELAWRIRVVAQQLLGLACQREEYVRKHHIHMVRMYESCTQTWQGHIKALLVIVTLLARIIYRE